MTNHMKNDMPNISSHLHISAPNYYNMNFITSSSDFITGFPWHFEINLCRLLLEDNFLPHKKMHISEYACKICLKELEILLKCRQTFEKFVAACNSSKNTGLPQFFFKVFWQLYFKNINFLTKTKKPIILTFKNSTVPHDR